MATLIRPSNTPATGGTDFRIAAEAARNEDFSASIWQRKGDDVNENASRYVEVQAFLPSRPSGGYAKVPVVSICLHSGFGIADIMLSPNEAREVADALIRADDESYDLGRPSALAQVLTDYGVDPDSVEAAEAAIRATL